MAGALCRDLFAGKAAARVSRRACHDEWVGLGSSSHFLEGENDIP
jgi:hypothetical protein